MGSRKEHDRERGRDPIWGHGEVTELATGFGLTAPERTTGADDDEVVAELLELRYLDYVNVRPGCFVARVEHMDARRTPGR